MKIVNREEEKAIYKICGKDVYSNLGGKSLVVASTYKLLFYQLLTRFATGVENRHISRYTRSITFNFTLK